ncbi:hypothetical protein [Streptomyces sp. NPDC002346]
MLDTTPLRNAYRTLLEAAATVADAGDTVTTPPPGEWNADQILAHVALVTATTVAAVSFVAAGANTTYDNRLALDTWTIEHTIAITGDSVALRDRIQAQAEALCTLAAPAALSESELDTPVPTRLLSHDKALVDQPMRLRELVTGLAEAELPGHTHQLLALLSIPSKRGGLPYAARSF